MGVIVARLRLAPSRETMSPSRAPFFQVALAARRAQVTAHDEDVIRGNLPVSPFPFHTITPACADASRELGWA